MTAAKQIYALPSEPAKTRRRKPAYAPAPQAAAAAERVTPARRQSGGGDGRWSTNSACSLNRLLSQPLPR